MTSLSPAVCVHLLQINLSVSFQAASRYFHYSQTQWRLAFATAQTDQEGSGGVLYLDVNERLAQHVL